MNLHALHRRLAALMAAFALVAFASGAGTDAPAVFAALAVMLLVALRPPGASLANAIEPVWKVAAIVLALRAAYTAVIGAGDVVLPMVDLLLLLLCAEALRPMSAASDGRLYSLSVALFVAASAYRPGAVFLVSFVAFVMVGTVALVVGHLARQARAHNVAILPLAPSYLRRVAVLSSVALFVAATVFATFPRVSRAWVNRGAAVETAVVGFADQVSLGTHGSRIHPNPAVALRVEFPRGGAERGAPFYWRGRSYDHFDGVRWSRSRGVVIRDPASERRLPPADLEQLVYGVPLSAPVLFGLPTVAEILPRSRIRPVREAGDDFAYLGPATPVYSVFSSTARADAAALRAVDYRVPHALARYLQMPAVTPRTRTLADSMAAQGETAYDRVRLLERWFQTTFAYTLDLPRTPQQATLDAFLFERRAGHCEYFSTAMVVLLRAQGIVARNVNGFLGGEWNAYGSFLTVTQNQAHSWVEVWFPGHGWITFDPTPAALTDIAARLDRGWFMRLQRVMAGVDHRWAKWVLDFDAERQVELLQRTTNAFAEPARGDAAGRTPTLVPLMLLILAGAAMLVLGWTLLRRWSVGRAAAVSRPYLRLRRLYARAGYTVPSNVPPIAFATALRRAGAPGAASATAAVRHYIELRFGGKPVTPLAIGTLRGDVEEARRALRRSRRRWVRHRSER